MPKRNVAYIKPDEPAFLKRIKQQIGYVEAEENIELKESKIYFKRAFEKYYF
jgi:hypothetical protein